MKTLLVAALVAVGAWFFALPYITIFQIAIAADQGDADALSDHIDFQSVRESLKEEIREGVKNSAKDQGFWGALGTMMVGGAAQMAVDYFITPKGIASMLEGNNPMDSGGSSNSGSDSGGAALSVSNMSYESFSRFVVVVPDENPNSSEEIRFILRRVGMGWQLKEIRFG